MSKINSKILLIVCLLLMIILGISVYAFRRVGLIDTTKTRENSEKFLEGTGERTKQVLDEMKNKVNKMVVKSRHGHVIPVEYIARDNNKVTIVLVHGHNMSLESMYPLAKVLLDNDINVVMYDQRAHGGNTAKVVTFGYYEKDDLEDVIDYVKNDIGKDGSIGVLGQSMGASTTGFYSGTRHASENVDFVVLDCPYNNMESVVKITGIKQGHNRIAMEVLTKLGSFANKIYMKFSYKDVDVVKAVGNSEVPTLVYESRYDKTCPYYMADEVFEGIKHRKKEKIMFDNSEHILGFYRERDKYIKNLLEFVSKYRKDERQ